MLQSSHSSLLRSLELVDDASFARKLAENVIRCAFVTLQHVPRRAAPRRARTRRDEAPVARAPSSGENSTWRHPGVPYLIDRVSLTVHDSRRSTHQSTPGSTLCTLRPPTGTDSPRT